MKYKNIIFDLDGTLIDSSPSIQDALQYSFLECGVTPINQIDQSVIGPPLRKIINGLIVTTNP